MCPRRKCTRVDDFNIQANILTNRFIEKGYSFDVLSQTLSKVQELDREQFMVEKPKMTNEETNFSWPFITGYSHQHYMIKKLVCKHWHILKNDHILGSTLPDRPQVVFRGVPSLKDTLAPGFCDPPTIKN